MYIETTTFFCIGVAVFFVLGYLCKYAMREAGEAMKQRQENTALIQKHAAHLDRIYEAMECKKLNAATVDEKLAYMHAITVIEEVRE